MSASAPSIIAPVEVIIVFYKEDPKNVNHPAPFPRELPKRCIKLFSFVGDVVLDPFAGSGTTLVEAINNKRHARGLEIDPEYIKNSLARIEKECSFSLEMSSITENQTPTISFKENISLEKKEITESQKELITGHQSQTKNKKIGQNIKSPAEFMRLSWEKALNNDLTRNDNGAVFEYLVAVCLYSKKILPFYWQAKISFVPNAVYDIALYNSEGYPITLNIKTSLRERYKQADLEGLALKNVHRRAKNYLITLSAKEYPGVKKKIQEGDVAGLDDIILADSKEFDELINELSHLNFIKPEAVKIIQGKEKLDQFIRQKKNLTDNNTNSWQIDFADYKFRKLVPEADYNDLLLALFSETEAFREIKTGDKEKLQKIKEEGKKNIEKINNDFLGGVKEEKNQAKMFMERKNIYTKLHLIQSEVKELIRTEENKFQKYKFFNELQVLKLLRPLLTKYQLTILLSDDISQPFIHEKDAAGSNVDLAKAKGSSETYAVKYLLAKFFLMPVKDEGDPDYRQREEKDGMTPEERKTVNDFLKKHELNRANNNVHTASMGAGGNNCLGCLCGGGSHGNPNYNFSRTYNFTSGGTLELKTRGSELQVCTIPAQGGKVVFEAHGNSAEITLEYEKIT
ncbi:27247_t:CDS:2 [Gigaspora margarita]|uniref:27247_t:CDS:1 n=1 Tax=Gigaspora margarita TaxID=4874 RepID=A0ABM8VVH9_GIGMA|nr:27247_t:CDS:2 [Gigaspora margarita]